MGLSIAHYKFWVRSWCVSSGLLSYDPLPSSMLFFSTRLLVFWFPLASEEKQVGNPLLWGVVAAGWGSHPVSVLLESSMTSQPNYKTSARGCLFFSNCSKEAIESMPWFVAYVFIYEHIALLLELCLVMLPLEVLCLWFTLRNGIPAYAIARGSVVIRVGEVAFLQSSLSFFWVLE
ncbi:hypothetical protein U1Q18_024099 [Sarracenia purpurea var. burkii]